VGCCCAALRVGLISIQSRFAFGGDDQIVGNSRAGFPKTSRYILLPPSSAPRAATAFWHRRTRTIFHSAITTSRKRQDGPCVNTATLMKYPTRSSVSWHNGHLSDLTLKMYACSYPVVSTSFDAQVLLCTHFYAASPVMCLPQRHNSVLDSHLR